MSIEPEESGGERPALRLLSLGPNHIGALSAELERGGFRPTFETVMTAEEFASALAENWDLVIGDLAEGRRFGVLSALRYIQEKGIDLPVIVVGGRSRGADVVAALKAGAADYIPQSNLRRLNAAVEREMRAARLRRDRLRLEEQFRQAQKMEAVGRLAGGVAHDFNNLLTVITGYSDLLLSGSVLSEAQRTALEEIRRSAERGGALTRQLLAFSRRQPMEARAVRVNQLVMQIEKLLRRLIGEDVELVTIPAASTDAVLADPGRLEQVIMNLAVNARDAMPMGGKLTIETGTVHLDEAFSSRQLGVRPGPHVTISITDTGVGMDEETQTHLFEPFFTTKTPGQGTGLGLATAYGIIRQSGGAIAIISELGKGTTARIFLPAAEDRSQPAIDSRQAAGAPRGAETVLVVEDEVRVRKLMVGLLGSLGYRVLEAARGREAVRIAREHEEVIHLALVDVVMPEMSGPEVVKHIIRTRPDIRVLYVSGYTEEALVHHRIPESGWEFLQKPFCPDALACKVREVLDTRTSAGSG